MDRATAEELQAEINEHALFMAAVCKDPDGFYYLSVEYRPDGDRYTVPSRKAWLKVLKQCEPWEEEEATK